MSDKLAIEFDRESWSVPRLYRWLQKKGDVPDSEMFRVFNMGVGLLVVVSPEQAETILGDGKSEFFPIGRVVERTTEAVLFEPPLS